MYLSYITLKHPNSHFYVQNLQPFTKFLNNSIEIEYLIQGGFTTPHLSLSS